MSDFWKRVAAPENVGGTLTEEAFFDAMEALREQQDRYHREGPEPMIYPASFVREQ